MKNFTRYFYLITLCLGVHHLSFAQGATTAKMNGRVLDENGEGLPGANVIAVHQPTGSQFGSVTNVEGLYNIVNMAVGGPYTVTVSFVGYEDKVTENLNLELAQTFRLDVNMEASATLLETVEVIATGGVFDGNRTGANTKVDERVLNAAPTISRDLSDFTRLDPRASINLDGEGNSVSFAGINNRFNAIFIDGAVNNDLFGLAQSGTNGGQTGISPISIDALQEVQIVLAPYDVTLGGFAGGGINAVTRSGTNEFEGSAYYLFRNEGIAGKDPETPANGSRKKLPDFTSKTYGARLGGPIIKNKLFFFVNAEIQRDETPEPFDFGVYNGTASEAEVNAIAAKVRNDYGYEPGDFLNTSNNLEGEKFLGKINWNINKDHKVSFRHSYTKATVLGRRTVDASNLTFENNGQNFPSTTNSSAFEWKANFSNELSNNLIVGYTTVRDDRDILGKPFPNISISDGNATINLGSEPFSFANVVEQDVLTITDNLTFFKGKHTFTFGTHNEFYRIFNLFLPLHVPQYNYASVDKFFADEAFLYLYGHEIGNQNIGDDAVSVAADFNAFQLAFYGQDEIQVSDKLKLTVGVRLDIPSFTDDAPQINTDFNNNVIPVIEAQGYDLEGAQAGIPPSTQFMFSPRVGFNYDLKGDNTTQIRGGIGVFTSRIPFVWPGGVYLRNGLTAGFTANFNGAGFAPPGDGGIPFEPDLNNQPFNDISPTGDIDLFAKDFKYPQILRTSLAVDQQLPWWGLIGTIDVQYTKTLNNILYQNVNIQKEPIGTLTGTPDNRPIFDPTLIDPDYTYITLATNTDKGYSFSGTIQLQKPFENGFTGSLAYTWTRAESIFDGTVFINSSQWQEFHSIGGRNKPDGLQRSQFDVGSRITSYLSYRKEYLNNLATTISLFYSGQSGQPFSYVYNDNDGTLNSNDPNLDEPRNLIYVPASAGEIILVDKDGRTAAQQWADLDAFISGDDYLSERSGQYAERNAASMPFESILDLKFLQDFYVTTANGRQHNLQFSFDIFNFSNFLNKDWGRRYFISDQQNFQLITFEGFEADGTTPTYSFTPPVSGRAYNVRDNALVSARWQAQMGLRYSF